MNFDHVKASVRPLCILDNTARILFVLQDRWIDCPHTTRILKTIENMVKVRNTVQAPCLLICGDGGMGKTSIKDRLISISRNWPEKLVFASLAQELDQKKFPAIILEAFGIPELTTKLKNGGLPKELLRIIQLRGIRAIVLDEFHDGLLVAKADQNKNLSILKALSGSPYFLTIIGLGTAEAKHALTMDEQLARRFDQIMLDPWVESEDFRGFLAGVEQCLPLQKPSRLYMPDTVRYLIQHSGGIMDNIIKMIKYGAVEAVLSGAEYIDKNTIERGAQNRWLHSF